MTGMGGWRSGFVVRGGRCEVLFDFDEHGQEALLLLARNVVEEVAKEEVARVFALGSLVVLEWSGELGIAVPLGSGSRQRRLVGVAAGA